MAIRSKARWAALAMVLVTLGGCASGGNEVLKQQDTATVNQFVVDGKTTRDEVLRIYGSPTQSSFLNEKNEIFTYRWARATSQGQNFIPIVGAFARAYDVHKKQLVIIFNEQNVVARHTMTDVNDSIKAGLADGGAPTGRPPDITAMSSIDSNVTGATAVVSANDDQSTPASSSSGAAAPSPKRNAVGSASSAAAPAATSAVQQAAATRAPARAAGSMPSPGVWECGVKNGKKHFILQIVVGANGSMTVTTYANAPATVVSKDPLTFTAVNPRGDRTMTLVWNTDNTLVISGLNSTDSDTTFRNEGACAKM
jgi:hypothetical protein